MDPFSYIMGKAMSAMRYKMTRPFRDYNIEARAHKAIERNKKVVSPRYPTEDALIKETIMSHSKDIEKSLREQDDLLLTRLKQVYVDSKDVVPETPISQENPSRPLPTSRRTAEDPEYGFFESKTVPYGKTTLREALDFISRHQQDPALWTAKKIAYEQKLDIGLTENVLQHFRTFVVLLPDDKKNMASLRSAVEKSPLLAPHTIQQIPSHFTDEKDEDKKS
ncbi:NADH dehydrogenase [ubiquinone] 1 alpha subcomplex assembly factor 4 isoform X2 [Oratosquilla oratoria]|uniref:NADH dehydrogenase [ubiquinone] 1 alpha subcomplex assembly factor 4 isoform X2 n=1 Tax=Oratosquilla oratoria TaxID=337810 RepID=UPI003F758D17